MLGRAPQADGTPARTVCDAGAPRAASQVRHRGALAARSSTQGVATEDALSNQG